MPKKSMELLTESMFYVLMALQTGPMCGIDAAEFIERRTRGRVQLGPATLYTILAKFEKEKYICETSVEGRKRTYAVTAKGIEAYRAELERLLPTIRKGKYLPAMDHQTPPGTPLENYRAYVALMKEYGAQACADCKK